MRSVHSHSVGRIVLISKRMRGGSRNGIDHQRCFMADLDRLALAMNRADQ